MCVIDSKGVIIVVKLFVIVLIIVGILVGVTVIKGNYV